MRKNMFILQEGQLPEKPPRSSGFVVHTSPKIPRVFYDKFIPEAVTWLFCFSAVLSATAADLRGSGAPQIGLLKEFRPIGGADNNRGNPNLNAVPGSPEVALTPLNFAPGTKNGLVQGPNPRSISNDIAGATGANGQNAESTDPVASAWLYVFGQFVDHDIDLEQNTPSAAPINIPIPKGDPDTQLPPGSSIAMTRDTRSPKTNTIINTVAGYLDLSQLYGSTTAVAASLHNADGTLKSSSNGLYLPISNDQFVTGDPRVMENPELTALTILFMREHNFWVGTLKTQHPNWTGDQLYNMAKAVTTAEYQNIVYKEFLPILLGPVVGAYSGYNSAVNAQATQEFSSAAFRVGHSQVSDTQEGIDNAGTVVFTESLADAFFNTPEKDISNGIDPLLRSLGTDFAQATDVYTVGVLRNLLFAPLAGGNLDLTDLIAIDIQRERDVGLGTLNQTRRAIGLRPYGSFAELTADPVLQKDFQAVYGNIGNVDLFMGGLAESHARGAVVGPTFQAIIARQFLALRAGDRFFWLNEGFDQAASAMISDTTLADILRRNTQTPNPAAKLFVQSALPTHHRPHVAPPAVIDRHGRQGPAFLNDGI